MTRPSISATHSGRRFGIVLLEPLVPALDRDGFGVGRGGAPGNRGVVDGHDLGQVGLGGRTDDHGSRSRHFLGS